MKDKLGQEITVGSIIAYGHVMGRSGGIRIGKVLKLSEKRVSPEYSSREDWEYRIQVRGIDDDWGIPKLNTRTGTLLYPSRVIVLQPEQCTKFWTLLEGA